MSKVAVVFWSGTGNTEAMANEVVKGAKEDGADVEVFGPADFNKDKLAEYDAVAFGCPAMGAEVLEEDEFEPMFTDIESSLADKKIALFGSFGWGDGQWMRDWEERCVSAGAKILADPLMVNEAPSDDDIEKCIQLGKALA